MARPRRKNNRRRRQPAYRKSIARQIQPSVPRPLKSQLVRMCWQNRIYWKPQLIANVQPTLGFTIAVNRPHNLLESETFVGSPQETWVQALGSSGTQPHLAAWAQLYEHYLVRGTKVTITFRTEGNSNTSDRSGKLVMVKHGLASDITQHSTYDTIIQNCPNFKVANVTASTTTQNQVRMSMGYSPASYHGIRKSAITANAELKGTFGPSSFTPPEEDAYISVAYASPFQAATTGAYNMPEGLLEVKIEQVLQLTDVKQSTFQQPMVVGGTTYYQQPAI